jgi:hypothetical protein
LFLKSLFARFVKLKFLCEVFCNYIPDVFWCMDFEMVFIDFGIKTSVSFENSIVNVSGFFEVGWNIMLKCCPCPIYSDFISILFFIQILSKFYSHFILILSRFFRNSLYPDFI